MKYFLIIILLLPFIGCSTSQPDIKSIMQTNNAERIRKNSKQIAKLLHEYKVKLDKRNPKNYNKSTSNIIKKEILDFQNELKLTSSTHEPFKNYVEYLNHAFSKNTNIINRNDYLIVGIYRMLFDAFLMNKSHKITALSYDLKKLQKAYRNLQILQWKIKTDRDLNNNYLFLTWQKNWQIELEKKTKNKQIAYKTIKNLKHIKSSQESIFEPSNMSFEIIVNKMLLYLKDSIELLGGEPSNLSLMAIRFFII